ncbi:glycoside hydrolase family 35 protein [Heterobasidion irregulare TC 32-1]|uniref:Beta-galactosidase n=1 Tax=Heterobasidion irregulare (strain TC 32-1) TaxID=747525 RepID=W4JZ00_HETIT|nr:glycoside hydrolase family 35 protein [Heterobasidion irregulare TC 32-1]ETW78704.1 glycoside hydrolase family 35 protein [Heterobasidion irregulare TC 32-1]
MLLSVTMLRRALAAVLLALSAASSTVASDLARRNSTGLTDAVTWDPHSLSIFGQRVFILSAEVHPWRQPNPDLWADVFEKIKANGFNTVSFYVHWALHYPTPDTNDGKGDWQEGTYRDLQRFIDEAKNAGLWMIARPGPYINAETTGGGFPGWVGNIAGSLRTDNINYTRAWKPYMIAVSQIIAKNQITNGGPIILVQAENEFSAGTGRSDYMQDIIDTYRANSIVIPTTHNDQHAGQGGNFSPDLPGNGSVNIYCGDSYPQGTSRWNQVQTIYMSVHKNVAPSSPLCLAEFGGGWLLGWGSKARGGTGYEVFETTLDNADYENVFYKENYAQTTTILNIYMLFGGTNWGQTAEPTVYSSYDYGGGINENRVATPKMNEMRLQGLFLRVSRDLLATIQISNGTNYTTSSLVHTAELKNLQSGAGFYVLRHNDATSTDLTTTQLNITTSEGALLLPAQGVITLNGRDSKILVTDYVFGQSATTILYSTAEILTWTTIDDIDYIIFYAGLGETGETTFKFSSQPQVSLNGASNVTSTYSGGILTLVYSLQGSKFVDINASGKTITVVILDKPTANTWHAPIIPGSGNYGSFFSFGTNQTILASGPYLIRTAAISGNTLHLTGDLNGTTPIEFIAPSSVDTLYWNGQVQTVTQTSHRSFTAILAVSDTPKLPTLGSWKVLGSLPEIDPAFDDSDFVTADQTTTNYTNLPPLSGTQVLYSQQYGFYGGNIIFRGHFNASGEETSINLSVQGGYGFGYSAFLNGVFLGSNQGNASVSMTTDSWKIPSSTLQIGKDNVVVVIQDHTGIIEAYINGGKEPRGIRGYSITGGNTTFTTWKLQGNQGGAAHAPDAVRGYLNEGGLYAERIGAHLPGFDDSKWASGTPLSGGGVHDAGVNFYRTTFSFDVPQGLDVPLRLSITPSDISQNYRVQIYLNGWQLGKYINNLGPQTTFVLPPGILKRQSENTLALSLWSLDSSGAALAGLELIADGAFSTSLTLSDYLLAPDYEGAQRPAAEYVVAMIYSDVQEGCRLSDETLAVLQTRLEELTSVPPPQQKLLYKGKKPSHEESTTLQDAGFKDGMKVQLLGATAEELGGMRKVEDEQRRRENIMRERAVKGTVKVRSTGPSAFTSAPSGRYRFHRLEPLQHLPNPASALATLERLSSDPAILHVMNKHEFSVGLLTELAPHEDPHLLGLNVNAGQAIKLRLRTDAYDGFRPYLEVRRVLCHELTHNKWGDHDNNFKELNSQLNREVVAFERAKKEGTHTLVDGLGGYEPSSELEAEARTYVLGGSGIAPSGNETVEDRRRRMLEATMNRLRKEEEELEHSCGTAAGPASGEAH